MNCRPIRIIKPYILIKNNYLVLILLLLLLINSQKHLYGQQMLDFKYDVVDKYNNFFKISSIILSKDYVRIQLDNYNLVTDTNKLYITTKTQIRCECVINDFDKNLKIFENIDIINNIRSSRMYYDSFMYKNYYFDKGILDCKKINIYYNKSLIIDNLEILGVKNIPQLDNSNSINNTINIGSLFDDRTYLSTSTMLLSFLEEIPLTDSFNNALKPKLSYDLNKS